MNEPTQAHPTDVLRVLIVDDHALVATAFAAFLSAAPDIAVVGEVNSLLDLESYFAGRSGSPPPDVAMIDYYLGPDTAMDAARLLAITSPTTKVVVISAHTSWEQLSAVVNAGCLGLVDKTDGVDVLLLAIRAAAKGQSSFHLVGELPRPRATADDATAKRLGALSPREREVLQLLADGLAIDGIAGKLCLSPHTVRNHVAKVLAKLGVHSRLGAVSLAAHYGVVEIPGAARGLSAPDRHHADQRAASWLSGHE